MERPNDMEQCRCELYGHAGPMYTAAVEGGQFVALIGQPLEPWYKRVAHEVEPSTSSRGEEQPVIILPAQIAQEEVVLAPERSKETTPAKHEPKGNTVPAVDANEKAQWQEQLAARYREMLRPRSGPSAPAERVPMKRAVKRQPEFRPADITALPAHMTAELVAPTTPPYIVQDNKILCRLPHCGVSDRKFETVAAWKKHVALARCHIEDAFCGTCGHHVIVPPGINGANVRAFITAHKKERCIGASNATLRQRRTEIAWLEGLLRTTGHILVPG
uniref:C2H2-type domain-containing protein n=1 Tax=Ascaris lumbricoides TaxID=6252 RepID=A0A0M3ID19_ASCLU